jgi:hypothetical protein
MSHSPAATLAAFSVSRRSASRRELTPSNRAREVEVIVDEPRHDGGAGEVDHVGCRPGVARDLGARAARDDAAFVDRERLDDCEVRVDGEDLAVREHGVDVRLRERRPRGERRQRADRASGERTARPEPVVVHRSPSIREASGFRPGGVSRS